MCRGVRGRGFVVYRGNASRRALLRLLRSKRDSTRYLLISQIALQSAAGRAPSFPIPERALKERSHRIRARKHLLERLFLPGPASVFGPPSIKRASPGNRPKQDSSRSVGKQDAPVTRGVATWTGVKQVYQRLYNYADYNLSIGSVSLNNSRTRHTLTSRAAISKLTLSRVSGTDS